MDFEFGYSLAKKKVLNPPAVPLRVVPQIAKHSLGEETNISALEVTVAVARIAGRFSKVTKIPKLFQSNLFYFGFFFLLLFNGVRTLKSHSC